MKKYLSKEIEVNRIDTITVMPISTKWRFGGGGVAQNVFI